MSLPDPLDSYVDALRLSEQDHQELVTQMDRGAQGAEGRDKRKSRRLAYRDARGMILQVTHPGGTSARFMVKPRNLSSHGVSVLHGGYLHPGTICVTPLRDLHSRPTPVRGAVAVCRHIRGRIHEVGIEFERSIAIQDFVLDAEPPASPDESNGASPAVTLPPLSGRVLVVDQWPDDRRLIVFDLRKLGTQVIEAESGADAMRRLRRGRRGGIQVVVAGEWLGDMSAQSLAQSLRKARCATPIIGIFSGGAEQAAHAVMGGISAVVNRPYTLAQVSSLLLQYLTMDASAAARDHASLSQRWSETELRPMILSFLQNLELRLGDLDRQLAGSASSDAMRACLQLKATAAGYGFPGLSAAADDLVTLLQDDAPLKYVRDSMTHLATLASAALDAASAEADASR